MGGALISVLAFVLASAGACAQTQRRDEGAAAAALTLPRPISGSPDLPPTSAIVPGGAYAAERDRCIDRELSRRGLNEFGDPLGTTYPGGSPLVDLSTGSILDRHEYVVRHRRDIGVACTRAPGEPRP